MNPKGNTSWVKGMDKIGGRKPGGRNKKTAQWEAFSNYLLNKGLERFQKELSQLKGKDYVNAVITLLEFHKPKLSRQTITDIEGNTMPVIQIMLPPYKSNGESN
jgi:hypothetical protein